MLRQQRGLRRARQVDTVEAGLVGACDGDLTAGQILDALATLLDAEPPAAREAYLPMVRELVAEGFLAPAWALTGRAGRVLTTGSGRRWAVG